MPNATPIFLAFLITWAGLSLGLLGLLGPVSDLGAQPSLFVTRPVPISVNACGVLFQVGQRLQSPPIKGR